MTEVKYTDVRGRTVMLDYMYIAGRKVRYIHIPDQVNIDRVLC